MPDGPHSIGILVQPAVIPHQEASFDGATFGGGIALGASLLIIITLLALCLKRRHCSKHTTDASSASTQSSSTFGRTRQQRAKRDSGFQKIRSMSGGDDVSVDVEMTASHQHGTVAAAVPSTSTASLMLVAHPMLRPEEFDSKWASMSTWYIFSYCCTNVVVCV